MSTDLIPLLSVAVALAGLILGMFYRQDRRIERMDSRYTRRFDELIQQIRELDTRQNHQSSEMEARQNLRFDEIVQQIKELSDRTGNLERGQSRLEGQLDIIRDAMFQRNPSQAD